MGLMFHTIIRAAFVCLFVCLLVCSPTPPRSFDGSSPNLVGVCRWTSELPLRGSFLKRSTGQTSLFRSRRHQAETTPLQKAHGVFCRARRVLPSKRHTASKSLIPSTGIFTSSFKAVFLSIYNCVRNVRDWKLLWWQWFIVWLESWNAHKIWSESLLDHDKTTFISLNELV